MNNTKYFVGLAGLVVGFLISFFWVSSYNKNNAPVAVQSPNGAMPAAGNNGGGNPQAMMGQVQQALDKAKNNPKDFQAQIEMARLYSQINRDADTVEYLKKAYEIDASQFNQWSQAEFPDALSALGMYYVRVNSPNDAERQKNYDESEKWFRRAVDAAPSDPEPHIEFASAYLQRQPPQPDKAIAELQNVLKTTPKQAHALSHLVEAYALKKDSAGADDALNRLRDADPSNQRLPALQGMVADLKAGKPVSLPKE